MSIFGVDQVLEHLAPFGELGRESAKARLDEIVEGYRTLGEIPPAPRPKDVRKQLNGVAKLAGALALALGELSDPARDVLSERSGGPELDSIRRSVTRDGLTLPKPQVPGASLARGNYDFIPIGYDGQVPGEWEERLRLLRDLALGSQTLLPEDPGGPPEANPLGPVETPKRWLAREAWGIFEVHHGSGSPTTTLDGPLHRFAEALLRLASADSTERDDESRETMHTHLKAVEAWLADAKHAQAEFLAAAVDPIMGQVTCPLPADALPLLRAQLSIVIPGAPTKPRKKDKPPLSK